MKVLRYAKDHVHVLCRSIWGADDEEVCFRGRGWSRCTAEDSSPEEFEEEAPPVEYHDGDRWVTIPEE